jgi:hypothetical protein
LPVVDYDLGCQYIARGTPAALLIRGLGSVGEIGTPRNQGPPLGIGPSAAGGSRFNRSSYAGVLPINSLDLKLLSLASAAG